MSLQQRLIEKYGNPLEGAVQRQMFEKSHMMILKYPSDVVTAIPCLGASVYCNQLLAIPLVKTFRELIKRGLHHEIKENDQCFLPRYQRGSMSVLSIHTWGLAIDLNPTQNPIYSTRDECIKKGLVPFTKEFVQCWRDMGWVVGEDFPGRPDLMHFEWTKNV